MKKIRELEREAIVSALEHFNGNVSKTAEALGLCVKTVYVKRKLYLRQGVSIQKLYPKPKTKEEQEWVT